MATTKAIIFLEDFTRETYFDEGATDPVNRTYNTENCNKEFQDSGSVSPDNATYDNGWTLTRLEENGKKFGKFEIRFPGDPADPDKLVGSKQRCRSEVSIIEADGNPEYTASKMWYRFKFRFPSNGYQPDMGNHETLAQWFESGDNDCVIRVYKGCAGMELPSGNEYDLFGDVDAPPVSGGMNGMYGKFKQIPLDEWHDILFCFVHSAGSDGKLEIWRDGVKIQTINEPTMYSDSLSKVKLGIYKAGYTEHPEDSTQHTRIVHVGLVKVGNENATYEMMMEGSVIEPPIEPIEPPIEPPVVPPIEPTPPIAPPPLYPSTGPIKPPKPDRPSTGPVKPPKPSTSDITGFKLVSAATETEVLTIVDNGSYSIGKYGPKLNIKVDTAASITKVAFELTGAMSLSKTDKVAPFSLHGDEIKSDGSLNYFYGNWNPPAVGAYTLTATPYNGEIIGVSSTIHFTFVQ